MMVMVDMWHMKKPQAEWQETRKQFLAEATRRGAELTLRDRVWAVTRAGEWVAVPGSSDSPIADRWWLGCDPEKLRDRHPIGVILLCQARGGPLYAIALPASVLHEVGPKLSRKDRQTYFTVLRRGERFVLQLLGGEEVDVTARVNDLSWLGGRPEADPMVVSEPGPMYAGGTAGARRALPEVSEPAAPPAPEATRFFAIVKNGNLHPLDDVALEPGAFYLVEARQAETVPASRSLRRILARGGPTDLPSDLAEQHDHYAHGGPRR